MPDEQPSVELRVVFAWTCPQCNSGNVSRAVDCEWTASDLREQYEYMTDEKLDPWQDVPPEAAEWLHDACVAPSRVKCTACGARVKTRDRGVDHA